MLKVKIYIDGGILMKKVISAITALILSGGLFAGCSRKDGASQVNGNRIQKFRIGLETDISGRGDKGFNDAAVAGLERIKEEFGAEVQIFEPRQADQYESMLKILAQNNDLIFGLGISMGNALDKTAEAYPAKKFAIVDYVSNKPNVVSIVFKGNEGAFLVGIVAGMMTKTNKIGFVGGIENDAVLGMEAGFIAGIKTVNQKAAEDLINRKNVKYAGNFTDEDKGYELATSLYDSGVDVIFQASGAVGLGVFDAAADMRKWAIGVDQDQAVTVPYRAEVILCSMVKKVDTAVYIVARNTIEGKFAGTKTLELGLKENGVGISATINPVVPMAVLKLVDKYRNEIINGSIVVPDKPGEALKNFKVPII